MGKASEVKIIGNLDKPSVFKNQYYTMYTLIRECFNDSWLMRSTIHSILCVTTLTKNGAILLKAKFKTTCTSKSQF